MKPMQLNLLTIFISSVVGYGLVYLITDHIQSAVIVGLLIGVGSAKWKRVKKQEADDEIAYDERVNINIKHTSFQIFSISYLLLIIYLIVAGQIFDKYTIKINYLLIYLTVTLIISYYIVPIIERKK